MSSDDERLDLLSLAEVSSNSTHGFNIVNTRLHGIAPENLSKITALIPVSLL
jgi:hypothetical protein